MKPTAKEVTENLETKYCNDCEEQGLFAEGCDSCPVRYALEAM